jgi:hypothetical protein
MSSHPPQGQANGPPSAGMGMQHQSGGQSSSQQNQGMSSQNLNQIVRIFFIFRCCLISPPRVSNLIARMNIDIERLYLWLRSSLVLKGTILGPCIDGFRGPSYSLEFDS